jgi:hypothetical protein
VTFAGTVFLSASASIQMLRRGGLPFGQVAKEKKKNKEKENRNKQDFELF